MKLRTSPSGKQQENALNNLSNLQSSPTRAQFKKNSSKATTAIGNILHESLDEIKACNPLQEENQSFTSLPATPTKRILESFDFHPAKNQSAFSTAKSLFQRSAKPTRIVAREEERQIINTFLQEKVLKRTASSMYISGAPGTGKSALMQEILQEQETAFKSFGVKVIQINCMSLKEPRTILQCISTELASKASAKKDFIDLKGLSQVIAKCRAKFVLLFLDEIDQLAHYASGQDILYSLFDLTQLPGSKLSIVAIANALDFTDRILPRLKSKNVEPILLHFAAYSVGEISEIISSRLKECLDSSSVISGNAIELAARKIASCTDLRKALDVVKQAIGLAERENSSVSIKHIMCILEGASGSGAPLSSLTSKAQFIKGLGVELKALLLIIFLLTERKTCALFKHQLFQKYQAVAQTYSWMAKYSFTDFDDILTQFEANSLISLAKVPKNGSTKVCCLFTRVELDNAIGKCTLLSSIKL